MVHGRLDRCESGVALGWAARPWQSSERLSLELLLDGLVVDSTVAQEYRPDVEAAGYGDGRFGFAIKVPAHFHDAVTHRLEVREAGSGWLLEGSPIQFMATPEIAQGKPTPPAQADTPKHTLPRAQTAPQIAGCVDDCLPGGIVGWAARADGMRFPVEVELRVDGKTTARAMADLHRADLAAAAVGGGSGHHGFRLPLPESVFDDQEHTVAVCELGTGAELEGSPRTVRFNACDHWESSNDDDHLQRRALGERALAYCEALPDDAFSDALHQTLLRMHTWMQSQQSERSRRRLRALLERVTALRCQLVLDGFVGAREIGGSLLDRWSASAALALELLEDGKVLAITNSDPLDDQRFVFTVAEGLLDGAVHRLALRIPAWGGTLGPWSFLLPSSAVVATSTATAIESEWDTLPAVQAARRHKKVKSEPTAVELARLALQDALSEQHAVPGGVDPQGADAEVLRLSVALGRALLAAGEPGQALEVFDNAAALDQTAAAPILGALQALLDSGQEGRARARLQEALQRFPDERDLFTLQDRLAARRRPRQVRTVAFYLPQFHPTPENDLWWGKGFTEWSNVAGATPLFDGHLQPRRPTSLGYYDLRLPEAANAQFDLARQYGIDGFCYYYYWFHGRRVLERPLMDLASGRTGPFPFCICWANEPWTRSWDGTSGEVLLAQNHTAESDLEFIKDLAPLLRHPDYIRVGGKPIVMVYRAEKLAEPRETVARWRAWCRAEGIGELHLCVVQSFGFNDPRPFGFDAAVEFPPHSPSTVYPDWDYHQEMQNLSGRVPGLQAKVFSYQVFANGGMKRPREPFALHRTAMVAWDNTARRGKSAHVFHGFTLATYERWVLANARKAAVEQDDAVSFVNAWNEWAEGSVMEPDVHFGYEILEATRRAKRIANFDPIGTYWAQGWPQFPQDRLAQRERVVLVGHDAFFAGAQTNLLNMARCLKRQLDIDVVIMLIEGGDLLPEYERVAPTFLIGKADGWQEALKLELRRYSDLGARKAICNTVVTGDVAALLKQEGFRVLGLVHELPALIESYDLSGRCWTLADRVDHIVCASRVVADEFCNRYWPESNKLVIATQGIAFNPHHEERAALRADVRKELGLPAGCAIVLGCGHGDTRKGIDLFVQLLADVARQSEPRSVAFVWVGTLDWQLDPYIQADVARLGLSAVFRVTGRTTDPARYFIAGDLFALTSREDPFPSVVMEAFDALLPVLAFDGAGGFVDIVNSDTGALIPYLDVAAMAQAALQYLREPERRARVGQSNHRVCRERFGYEPYLKKLLALLADVPAKQVMAGLLKRQAWFSDQPRPTITAIVPNFNYATYLELRLRTIIAQTLPPDEIIVLDDASTDGSLDLIRAIAAQSPIPIRVLANETNTGNPFVQWAKGLELASGDLVWIAEADDYCEPTLLETLAHEMTDRRVVLAWADSVMVDDAGGSQGAQYKHYYDRSYGAKWHMRFRMQGRRLIDDCLLTENVIPNASAALFRRNAVTAADLALIQQYRFSGDWWFWLSLAQAGDVHYCATPLNYHRRHARSVMGDVLRAGESLLPETMGFYERVAVHKPDCLSAKASLQVLGRLQRLFEMFPALSAVAPRIAEHPTLAVQYAALMRAFARAGDARAATPAATTTLVLSQDVLAPEMNGAALLLHLGSSATALRVVLLAAQAEAEVFTKDLGAPGLDIAVLDPQAPAPATAGPAAAAAAHPAGSSLEQRLRGVLGDIASGNVVSHGLLANCLVASVAGQPRANWLLVAGPEFEVILGHLPKAPGVTIAGIRLAMSRCGMAQFVGAVLPHAFARMAQALALPVDQLRLTASVNIRHDRTAAQPIRVLGIAGHASAAQWRAAAQALSVAAADLARPIRLRLLAWGRSAVELMPLEQQEPIVELIHLYDRPAALSDHGEIMLVATPGGDVGGSHLALELQRSAMHAVALESVFETIAGRPPQASATELLNLLGVVAAKRPTADAALA